MTHDLPEFELCTDDMGTVVETSEQDGLATGLPYVSFRT
ncbi:MAG: hypothetical protein HZB54_01600 [Deltaproteobacteria bacterium]|nr:hypothetical protein [Deltaproteobacteria bacterium]